MFKRRKLAQRIDALPVVDPPPGWRLVVVRAIGGLTEVGFDRCNRLLVISADGRGLVDTESGSLVARDSEDRTWDWIDRRQLTALSIGPGAGEGVRVSSLAGGGLPVVAPDATTVTIATPVPESVRD